MVEMRRSDNMNNTSELQTEKQQFSRWAVIDALNQNNLTVEKWPFLR